MHNLLLTNHQMEKNKINPFSKSAGKQSANKRGVQL